MDTQPPYVALRTCRVLDENGEPKRRGRNSATPLTDFAEAAAYVLLAEPGAGKTTAFETEAAKPRSRALCMKRSGSS